MTLAPPSPSQLMAYALPRPDEETLAQVRQTLADLQTVVGPSRWPERRRAPRRHFPYLLSVTSLDPKTGLPQLPAQRGVGRQLSEFGLDFYYAGSLPTRHVLVEVETSDGRLRLPLELTWCRFLHDGWFEHGGRFVSLVAAWDELLSHLPPNDAA